MASELPPQNADGTYGESWLLQTLKASSMSEADFLSEMFAEAGRMMRKSHSSFQPVSILDHGQIQLLDVMGNDGDIYRAARASFGKYFADFEESDSRRVLRLMLRHGHTSPFEQAEVKFLVKCPIFVHRQWIRHRTANVNEISGRYAELPEEFFMPEVWRAQSKSNKQGSEGVARYAPEAHPVHGGDMVAEEIAFHEYHDRIKAGVSRELARTCLPLSTYTEMVWKCDLHNTMGFIQKRADPHAQEETRLYAEAMYELLEPLFPLTFEAFRDYRMDAVTLSRQEQQILAAAAKELHAQGCSDMARHGREACEGVLKGRELDEFLVKLERIAGSRS